MTTKEFIKKYNLDKGIKFSHTDLVNDMKSELLALLEINKALDNIKGFDNAVRCVKMKWDAIENKTLGVFPEKLWGFFFATVIAKFREELCPREMQRRRDISDSKKKEWEERRKWEDEAFGFNDFWERMWSRNLLASILSVPTLEFQTLGIMNIEGVTIDDVKSKYRELSKIHHPDKGGKQDVFVNITNAKNKCLAFLSK